MAAFSRYEDKSEGLGAEFLVSVDSNLELILEFPEMAPVYHQQIRRCVVSRFPYGVFYAVESHRIVVHAVLDLRQDPQSLRRRFEH